MVKGVTLSYVSFMPYLGISFIGKLVTFVLHGSAPQQTNQQEGGYIIVPRASPFQNGSALSLPLFWC